MPTFTVAWRLPEELDSQRLGEIWSAFCASREFSTLRVVEERPLPRWSNSGTAPTSFARASARDETLQAVLAQMRARPWNLALDAGIRGTLVSTGPVHVFLIEIHPMIADEQSFAASIGDFLAQVSGHTPATMQGSRLITQNEASTQPPPSVVDHWRTYLAGAPTVVDLPWDGPRLNKPSCAERTVFSVAPETSTAFQVAGGALTTPPLLIAAVAAVCGRISGQDDMVLGCLSADKKATHGPIGSVWPVRIDLRDDPRGDNLLAAAQEAEAHLVHHSQVPLASIIEHLAGAGRQEHPPLFQIIVGREPDLTPSTLGEPVLIDSLASTTYLAFLVTANHALAVYANPDLVSSELAHRLAQLVTAACNALAEEPSTRLSALPLQTPIEEAALRASLGHIGTFSNGPCLHEQVSQQVNSRPNAIALSMDGRNVTYAELDQRANRLARYLITLGVGPDILVGHCLRRTVDAVVAILAILKAGGAYVPLDPAHPGDRLMATVADAATPVVVCESRLADHFRSSKASLVVVDSDADVIASHSDHPIPTRVTPEHLAYVIYTSGSTGRPKGVPITHAQVVRLFTATASWFSFTPKDVWTLFHSLAFDFSVWELWGPLLYGGRLVLVDELVQRSPADFHALIRREGVTVLNQTPAAFYQFAQADEDANAASSLRLVIFGGEKLELSALRRWFDRHGDQSPRLVNMYGITETTVHVTYRPLSKADLARSGVSPIGVPIPDLSLYLLDSALRPVPVGVIGELFVGGAGVGRGYLNRPELTAERFIADPFRPGQRMYRSGDAARKLSDGEIDYVGRLDQQVKIRGYRIELGEIDAVLRRQPTIADCAVTVHQSTAQAADRSLVAYVVLRDYAAAHDPVIAALRQTAKAALPSHMVPAGYVVLERLPLTVNGKLDRRALPAPNLQTLGSGTVYSAPSTSCEHTIARAWSRILGADRIGIDDNFFDIGGNSLRLVQVQGLLEQDLARAIPVVDLFQYPTIRALGRHLADTDTVASVSAHQATLERARRQQQALSARRRPERPA